MDQTQGSRCHIYMCTSSPDAKVTSATEVEMMEGEEGNIGKYLNERNEGARGWTGPDAESRMPRSEEEMKEEARCA
jgi:hypothetical protein